MKINNIHFGYLLLCFIFLCRCSNFDTNQISDGIIGIGLQQQKRSIVLLPSSLDEDFDELIQEANKEQIACYKANQNQKNLFEKILGTNITSPMYVIISGDTILNVAVYMQGHVSRLIISENRNVVNYFEVGDTIVMRSIVNDTFKKRLLWEKLCQKEIVLPKNYTARASSSFYNKYLTSRLLQATNQMDEASNLLEDLWINFTSKEAYLYKEELIDIMECRKKLPLIEQNDIKFDYKRYDFGEIAFDDELNCSFPFKNMSEHKLAIFNISVSCGCMAASCSKGVINPGCTDSIVVTIKKNQPGFVTKDILLYFNCKKPIKLKVSANIVREKSKE